MCALKGTQLAGKSLHLNLGSTTYTGLLPTDQPLPPGSGSPPGPAPPSSTPPLIVLLCVRSLTKVPRTHTNEQHHRLYILTHLFLVHGKSGVQRG